MAGAFWVGKKACPSIFRWSESNSEDSDTRKKSESSSENAANLPKALKRLEPDSAEVNNSNVESEIEYFGEILFFAGVVIFVLGLGCYSSRGEKFWEKKKISHATQKLQAAV